MKQHNLLLIGLGGTGSAVVRELKKQLYVEWRSRGGTGSYPEIYNFQEDFGKEKVESRVATLSIDSNARDLSGEGELSRKWRVFGETLRLGDREKVLIDPSGINRILDSIERYPGIQPWIHDDMPFVRDITRGTTEPAGCNQIRRMGRLALANGNNIKNVMEAVADRLSQLSSGGQVGAEIHIACTLAAGTGSGSLIDVIMQIQKYLKSQPGQYSLFIHGFATAKDVGDVNTGNFYANQYAALSELNALRLASYHPWDITAKTKPTRLSVPLPDEISGDLPGTFRSVALITDTTEGNTDVPLNHQIDNVAEFIFQLSVRQMGDVPKELRDALTLEDRKDHPADANGGNRSTAFIGYGVQRAAIPEREIREKLVYTFGRQFVLKMLYNNWDDRFRDSPRNFSEDGFVDSRRGIWKVAREHLYLDRVEDITGQPEFPSYETEWREELSRQADRVRAFGDDFNSRKGWLSDFDRRAEDVWDKGFRLRGHSGGVVDYFRIRREPAEIRTRAKNLRAILEKDLLQHLESMDPEYPLHHLPKAIGFLLGRIESERVKFGQETTEAGEHIIEVDRHRGETRQEYQKIGRLAMGKHQRLFSIYCDSSIRFYYWRTVQLAFEYAQDFCLALIEELKSLQQEIILFDTRLKQIGSMFETEIAARISQDVLDEKREEIDYLVDADYVNKAIRESFECDQSIQDQNADITIDTLKQLRGDRFEFAAYNEKIPVDDHDKVGGLLVDELRRVSEQNAIEAHRKIREDNADFDGIFGQNLVLKLYNDYGGQVDGGLEEWLRHLIDRAMPMVSFDPNEEPMDLPTQGPILRRCVFVPQCKSVPKEFEQRLQQKIKSIRGNNNVPTYYKSVPEDRNPGEIVIITVAFFFAARHTRVVHGLKDHYLQRLDQNSEKESHRAYFNVHTETHHPRLPDLMKQSRHRVLEEQFAPVLLASALGLMRIPEKDGEQISFGLVDNFGRVKNKINTGMKINAGLREIARESEERFGHDIPLEIIVLYSLYQEQFQESSLSETARFVQSQMAEIKDTSEVEALLDTMSGQAFLLAGKRETDSHYQLFDLKSREALELAKRLADRSSL